MTELESCVFPIFAVAFKQKSRMSSLDAVQSSSFIDRSNHSICSSIDALDYTIVAYNIILC